MVVLKVLFLLGSLFGCGHGGGHLQVETLKNAALEWQGPLTCKTWDCDCTFNRQVGCCCAANQMFDLEENTFKRISDLWHSIEKLGHSLYALKECRQISFKATMDGSLPPTSCFGSFNTNVTVPYSVVTLNDGNGYNPSLGVFTAPCDGVYVFSFTVYSSVNRTASLYHKIQLMLNGVPVAGVWEQNREDFEDNACQVVVLEMVRGDQVYIQMTAGRKICGSLNYNIFTGYMLYTHDYSEEYYEEYYDYD